jgi:hypothetical protein
MIHVNWDVRQATDVNFTSDTPPLHVDPAIAEKLEYLVLNYNKGHEQLFPLEVLAVPIPFPALIDFIHTYYDRDVVFFQHSSKGCLDHTACYETYFVGDTLRKDAMIDRYGVLGELMYDHFHRLMDDGHQAQQQLQARSEFRRAQVKLFGVLNNSEDLHGIPLTSATMHPPTTYGKHLRDAYVDACQKYGQLTLVTTLKGVLLFQLVYAVSFNQQPTPSHTSITSFTVGCVGESWDKVVQKLAKSSDHKTQLIIDSSIAQQGPTLALLLPTAPFKHPLPLVQALRKLVTGLVEL